MSVRVTPKRLGRLPARDEFDQRFPLGDVLPAFTERTYRYWPDHYQAFDQGETPQCVAYAWTHFLTDSPDTVALASLEARVGSAVQRTIYGEAQTLDEWPGEDYDGTSVRAGAKALQARGFIDEYRWATGFDEVLVSLLTTGPVIFGTVWTESMFTPDAKGVIHPLLGESPIVGGHAYVVNGYNARTGLLRLKNSWGLPWGIDGHAYLRVGDSAALLERDGEAVRATQTANL